MLYQGYKKHFQDAMDGLEYFPGGISYRLRVWERGGNG